MKYIIVSVFVVAMCAITLAQDVKPDAAPAGSDTKVAESKPVAPAVAETETETKTSAKPAKSTKGSATKRTKKPTTKKVKKAKKAKKQSLKTKKPNTAAGSA